MTQIPPKKTKKRFFKAIAARVLQNPPRLISSSSRISGEDFEILGFPEVYHIYFIMVSWIPPGFPN